MRPFLLSLSLCVLLAGAVHAEPPASAPAAPEASRASGELGRARGVRRAGAAHTQVLALRTTSSEELRAARRAAWRGMMRNLRSPAELPASVRKELRTHAWRMARMLRIRALASQAHELALVQRTDQLIAREQARHRERIARAWPATPHKKRAAQAAPAAREEDDDDREREPEETEDPEARP